MGRRRNRKRDRRNDARQTGTLFVADDREQPSFDQLLADDDLYFTLETRRNEILNPVSHCGTCQEFVEDQEGGRGTCLHPGSGILSPWTDTPGCPFHSKRRR